MPRVAINRKKYMLTDLSEWITGRMKTLNLRQSDVGAMIGISQPAFRQRLISGIFTTEQLFILFKELNASDEEILRLSKW